MCKRPPCPVGNEIKQKQWACASEYIQQTIASNRPMLSATSEEGNRDRHQHPRRGRGRKVGGTSNGMEGMVVAGTRNIQSTTLLTAAAMCAMHCNPPRAPPFLLARCHSLPHRGPCATDRPANRPAGFFHPGRRAVVFEESRVFEKLYKQHHDWRVVSFGGQARRTPHHLPPSQPVGCLRLHPPFARLGPQPALVLCTNSL